MPEKPETLADALANARTVLAEESWIDEITLLDEDGEPDDYAQKVVRKSDMEEAIDRIEAAAERERNAHTNDIHDALYKATGIPGNAAALRESLEQCGRALEKAQCSSAFQAANTGASYITAALSSAHAALAAPARNVDRFATAKDALDAFIREKEITSADVDNMNLRDFFDWLFAPAEGKEADNG